MHDLQMQQRFIQLRSQGWSFVRIAKELGVAKQTLITWSRKHQHEIQNLRAIELEGLQEQLLFTREARARILTDQLRKAEGELAKRSYADLTTSRLFSLVESLRNQVVRELGPTTFSVAVRDIPDNEYSEQAQDWNP